MADPKYATARTIEEVNELAAQGYKVTTCTANGEGHLWTLERSDAHKPAAESTEAPQTDVKKADKPNK